MVEGLFKRAKAFIGMEEEGEEEKPYGQQLDMSTILKGKREAKGEPGYEVMVYEPKVYEDSLNISTNLRSGSPVIINLKHLDPTEGTRLIDFVCGTAYAIDGHMMKIGETIFLFTPNSIAITSAEERSSLEEEITFEQEKRETFFSR
ncbi:MAG: cell division protein SepF [Candidatus Margulisbacteria bacterium]|nr:cell division protein SepF [Candidatus Margulisiibacteriota bacterium]